MESNTKEVVQARVRPKIKTKFEELFNESNFDTKGEFINHLLDKSQEPEKVVEKPIVKVEEVTKIVEIPAKLKGNQVLVNLTPIQKIVLLEAVDMKVPKGIDPNDPDPDGTGTGEDIEFGQGDTIFKDQNYYAMSPSINEKYGNVFSPLVYDEPDKNMGRILINTLMLCVYKGYYSDACVPEFSRKQLRGIAQELKEQISEKEKMTEFVNGLSEDEKKQLFGEILKNGENTNETPMDTYKEADQKTKIEET